MAFDVSEKRSSLSRAPLAEINIVPLVDVMLVLLIIFMVTAPLLQEAIRVNLPAGKSDSEIQGAKSLTLTLQKSGIITVGNETIPYSLGTIETPLLKFMQTENTRDFSVYIRADKDISYGQVIALMSLIKELGIEKVGLVTTPSKPS